MPTYHCRWCGIRTTNPYGICRKSKSPTKRHSFAQDSSSTKVKSNSKDNAAGQLALLILIAVGAIIYGIYKSIMWLIDTFGMVIGIGLNVIFFCVISYIAFILYRKTKKIWFILYLVVIIIGLGILGHYLPDIKVKFQVSIPNKTQPTQNETQKPTRNEPQVQNEIQTPNPSTPKIDYEQKFGKRIYLATKDEFVNMRNAPSGEIVAKIYKKDFESIMIYSFDTNSNEKWLKVVYFPPNTNDEQNAISGYIHISQIDKNKLN